MKYQEFKEQFVEDVKSALYEKGIEDVEIGINRVDKMNESYVAMTVLPKGSVISANFHLADYFDALEDGVNYQEIVNKAVGDIEKENDKIPSIDLNAIQDYGQVKERLSIEVVSAERNADVLETVPHKLIEDMAIIYKINVELGIEDGGTVLVNDSLLKMYGISQDQLHEDAVKNASIIKPFLIRGMSKEFAQSKKEYFEWTGRKPKGDIIAYQIRQSFKPGEITPEKANQVGYETAMRFTKGEHAFVVATHIDKAHIHNHIIFNSTNLACNRKFRDTWFIAIALQRLSDLVCLENGLSVIKPRKPSERERYTGYEKRETLRSKICEDIEIVLLQQPRDFEEFLKLLQEQGYELKSGKHPAVKGTGQKRFIRFRSLGAGYTKEDIEKRIFEFTGDRSQEPEKENTKKKRTPKREFDLLIDIQEKMKQGKGVGYTKWATVYNIKQMAQTLLFLQESNIRDYDTLAEKANGASSYFRDLTDNIKSAEKRLGEIAVLKTHILNYMKTREVFVEYKKSGYSKKFYEEHEGDLVLYKAARDAFEKQPDKKIPKIKELNVEYAELLRYKQNLYAQYRQSKKEMQDFVTAKQNVDSFLRTQEQEQFSEKQKRRETQKKKNTER